MWKVPQKCGLCNGHFPRIKLTQIVDFSGKSQETVLADGYKPVLVEAEELECYNYFIPDVKTSKKFSLILPPPNITGSLHLGHAFTATIQDVIVRWKRMQGMECVWVPGVDHAGIATQVVVEKLLWKESRQSRHEVGRDVFQERVWKWKEEKARVIEAQLRRIGMSLDWPRQFFTMDPIRSGAVSAAFIELFDSGLIYRADQLVNWSCSLQSAISDIEVDHLEVDGPTLISLPAYSKPVEFGTLTYFAYKLHNSDEEVVVATTRPETMLGDVAVAVHPRDDRYGRLVGRYLWHPLRKQTIPIISDDFVDPNFGTGAVKVTPAHDHTDFQVGARHGLETFQVIDEKGNLTPQCGELAGIPRFQGRDAILSKLQQLQLLRGKENHRMTVPICSRSQDVVEFLVKPQWFVKCREMAQRAAEDVRRGQLHIEPPHFEKVWFSWLENIRDWCISRQLWWGHRIPIYACEVDGRPAVWISAHDEAAARLKAAARLSTAPDRICAKQDEDVLDTWFSSALLPFTAFNWPQEQNLSDYPLSLMETGHDILFFWVARMVMLGTRLTGKLPFNEVLLHGVICDPQGRKMSKSLGNVVAPEDVVSGRTLEELEAASRASHDAGILSAEELAKAVQGQKKMFPGGIPECGADALRFTLCSHNIKSHFINFDVQECHTNKLFCNKIWQATKYVNGAVERTAPRDLGTVDFSRLMAMDRWILSRLTHMVETCWDGLEKYDFHVTTAAIKNFLYYEFCDVYLETTKRGFRLGEDETAARHCWTLTKCLDVSLRTLAPFMPRLTQHLHRKLAIYQGQERKVNFPEKLHWRDESLEQEVAEVLDVVVGIRRLKKFFGVVAKHNPNVYITGDPKLLTNFKATVEDLASTNLTILPPSAAVPDDAVSDKIGSSTVIHLVVPSELRNAVELDLPKLKTKEAKLIKQLEKMNKMVSGDNYATKAAREAQQTHAKKIAALEEKLARINYMRSLSEQ